MRLARNRLFGEEGPVEQMREEVRVEKSQDIVLVETIGDPFEIDDF